MSSERMDTMATHGNDAPPQRRTSPRIPRRPRRGTPIALGRARHGDDRDQRQDAGHEFPGPPPRGGTGAGGAGRGRRGRDALPRTTSAHARSVGSGYALRTG